MNKRKVALFSIPAFILTGALVAWFDGSYDMAIVLAAAALILATIAAVFQ